MWILFTFTHIGIHFAGYIYNREEVLKKKKKLRFKYLRRALFWQMNIQRKAL